MNKFDTLYEEIINEVIIPLVAVSKYKDVVEDIFHKEQDIKILDLKWKEFNNTLEVVFNFNNKTLTNMSNEDKQTLVKKVRKLIEELETKLPPSTNIITETLRLKKGSYNGLYPTFKIEF